MTAYVRRPFPAKKHELLRKRENVLLHLLQQERGIDKLRAAAEAVRQAYLGVQKGNIYYAKDVPTVEEVDVEQIKKAESQIAVWESLPIEEIIAKYQSSRSSTEVSE